MSKCYDIDADLPYRLSTYALWFDYAQQPGITPARQSWLSVLADELAELNRKHAVPEYAWEALITPTEHSHLAVANDRVEIIRTAIDNPYLD